MSVTPSEWSKSVRPWSGIAAELSHPRVLIWFILTLPADFQVNTYRLLVGFFNKDFLKFNTGLGIYKRKNENTQERKHARVHANTHENTHSYKKAINNRNRPIKMIYVKI